VAVDEGGEQAASTYLLQADDLLPNRDTNVSGGERICDYNNRIRPRKF
jgi:hypothetical protein